jgi:DNA-binding protein YbaB
MSRTAMGQRASFGLDTIRGTTRLRDITGILRKGGRSVRPEWRAHIDEMLEQYRTLRDKLGDTQQRMSELTATAESADGMIRATVGPRGELTGLDFDPRILRRYDVTSLAEAIVETTAAANQQLQVQRQEIMGPVTPTNLSSRVPPGAQVDLTRLFPEDPTDLLPPRGGKQ